MLFNVINIIIAICFDYFSLDLILNKKQNNISIKIIQSNV